jgi:hypothetical protein
MSVLLLLFLSVASVVWFLISLLVVVRLSLVFVATRVALLPTIR